LANNLEEVIMESKQSRRHFLQQGTKFGGACCALLAGHRILPAGEIPGEKRGQDKKPLDLAQFSHCGIPCALVCPLYKATQNNDVKMKKILYERQEMKKNFGIEFDPDKVFCYTCKPGDKPKKVGLDMCEVRICSLANEMESCLQCENLDACDKAYWKKWPEQYASTKYFQARYKTQPGAVIKEGKAR
jgi:hypothetical protein